MATYTGLDKRLAYLFANGGGGGGSCKVISGYYHDGSFYEDQSYTQIITGSEDSLYIDLDTTTLYLFDGTDYVEVQGGGGGAVSDGTAGVRISVTLGANSSVTYDWSDIGIDDWGSYLISMVGESAGYSQYFGMFARTAYLASSLAYSGLYAIRSSYANVSFSDSTKQMTFSNTSSYAIVYEIEVLPLHPKIEIPKHTYSTTEQVVGTWIDGKPIYEVTIDCGYFQNTRNAQYFQHGISDLDFVIDLQGFFYASVASGNLPFFGTASDGISIWVEPTRICTITQSDRSGFHYYVTLRYTKTTQA